MLKCQCRGKLASKDTQIPGVNGRMTSNCHKPPGTVLMLIYLLDTCEIPATIYKLLPLMLVTIC